MEQISKTDENYGKIQVKGKQGEGSKSEIYIQGRT